MTVARVLVVDDHPDAAETACILLEMLGYECRFATCGLDGLREAEAFEPDVARAGCVRSTRDGRCSWPRSRAGGRPRTA